MDRIEFDSVRLSEDFADMVFKLFGANYCTQLACFNLRFNCSLNHNTTIALVDLTSFLSHRFVGI
jgi:hypothetical protein